MVTEFGVENMYQETSSDKNIWLYRLEFSYKLMPNHKVRKTDYYVYNRLYFLRFLVS